MASTTINASGATSLTTFGQLVDRVGDGSRGLVLGHQDGLPRTAGPEGLADLAGSAALPHSNASLVTSAP